LLKKNQTFEIEKNLKFPRNLLKNPWKPLETPWKSSGIPLKIFRKSPSKSDTAEKLILQNFFPPIVNQLVQRSFSLKEKQKQEQSCRNRGGVGVKAPPFELGGQITPTTLELSSAAL
jgi:hypothetical protein